MAERKKITIGGISYDVTELNALQREEHVNEYELEDGAIIRVANPSLVIYRVEGPVDPEGNPGYFVKNGTSVIVVRGPQKQ